MLQFCMNLSMSLLMPFEKNSLLIRLYDFVVPVGDVNLLVWSVLGTWELLMPQSFNHHPVSVIKSATVKCEYIFDYGMYREYFICLQYASFGCSSFRFGLSGMWSMAFISVIVSLLSMGGRSSNIVHRFIVMVS